MTQVREVMTSEPALVEGSASVVDIAKMMEAGDMGAVIVCDESGRPHGVVTDRDLAIEVLAAGRDVDQTTASDLLVGVGAVTVDAGDALESAVKTMKEHAVRRLPVVDDDEVVGVVSQADIARVDADLAAELIEVISMARDNTARG